MKKLKDLQVLKNKIKVMDYKQKIKLKKMANESKKAQKIFKRIVQKTVDQQKKEKRFDEELRNQIKLRKKVISVREEMREKLVASKQKMILNNRKVKRSVEKKFKRQKELKEQENKVEQFARIQNKMKVIMSRENAKLNVAKTQRMKKIKVKKILHQERMDQDAQTRRVTNKQA